MRRTRHNYGDRAGVGDFLSKWREQMAAALRRRSPARTWWQRAMRIAFLLCAAWVAASLLLVLVLRWAPIPCSSVMAQQWMRAAWQGATFQHHWRPWSEIAPEIALAVLAAEDQRFPEHYGFDFIEMQRALAAYEAGRALRGASTISQQTAKNLFLWSGRSWLRKGLELWFTALLELLWPKQRILEVYLNIAEFGAFTFGVEAASQRFFHQPASALTATQAALLAAVLPNPHRYQADKPSRLLRERQRWIEQQMRQLGGTAYLHRL